MTNLNIPGLGTFADVAAYVESVGVAASAAARVLARVDTQAKNAALIAMAAAIRASEAKLLAANAEDVAAAAAAGQDSAFVDRLTLTPKTIAAMADGVEQIAALPDPIGEISDLKYRPSGIQVGRMRVPLGVIGIIYESRPNVTVDAAALCLKAGNATILRGGSEAMRSNQCDRRLRPAKDSPPRDCRRTRCSWSRPPTAPPSGSCSRWTKYVDVIVPRGGKGLIERVAREARVPVIKHLDGICHVYIDDRADSSMAIRVADNAKTQRYSPATRWKRCWSHAAIAARVLPALCEIYAEQGRRAARRRARSRALVPAMKAATEDDWRTEYLAPILAVRVVDGPRRGDRAHRALRLAAHRRDRHRGLHRARCASCAKSIRAR